MTADVRPAYPSLLGESTPAGKSADGHWIVCDEASSTTTYTFAAGHGSAPMAAANQTAQPDAAPPRRRTPTRPPTLPK